MPRDALMLPGVFLDPRREADPPIVRKDSPLPDFRFTQRTGFPSNVPARGGEDAIKNGRNPIEMDDFYVAGGPERISPLAGLNKEP